MLPPHLPPPPLSFFPVPTLFSPPSYWVLLEVFSSSITFTQILVSGLLLGKCSLRYELSLISCTIVRSLRTS